MIHTSMVPTQASIDRISIFEERRFLDALGSTAELHRNDAHGTSDVSDSG
jgi:hypothetical protein